jgi:hypothetical protein
MKGTALWAVFFLVCTSFGMAPGAIGVAPPCLESRAIPPFR